MGEEGVWAVAKFNGSLYPAKVVAVRKVTVDVELYTKVGTPSVTRRVVTVKRATGVCDATTQAMMMARLFKRDDELLSAAHAWVAQGGVIEARLRVRWLEAKKSWEENGGGK